MISLPVSVVSGLPLRGRNVPYASSCAWLFSSPVPQAVPCTVFCIGERRGGNFQ